ncbi:MAG TPA: hypothetical protein VLJ57_14130 [Burkholderiaceae bacterium]|nr:hypothetical protein [Burkholderiaceae bacterium]
MHNAPAVTYPVGRSRLFGCLLAAFWLLGAVSIAGWCLLSPNWTWKQGFGVFCLALCGMCAARSWWRMGTGELCWDGQNWHWASPSRPATSGQLAVHLDLQRHMLLRLKTAGGVSHWCWAEQFRRPERWPDLRRAVYSRAKSAAVPHDIPETAAP